jgi:UDP-N-acetylglucosamine acyltransferase
MPTYAQNKSVETVISKSASIHKTAIISPKDVTIGEGVVIGPYCVLEGNIVLKNNVTLESHVVISGNTEIGENTKVSSFAVLGSIPQDLKFGGEKTYLIIGKDNRIREHVTISCGTKHGGDYTRIGNNNLIMINAHVGHDCKIGNNVVISNNVGLAGHIIIDDYAIVGGNSGVHQFVRIGKYVMIGGMSGVVMDIPPFAIYTGNRSEFIRGINIIGLKRHGFKATEIKNTKEAYDFIFGSGDKGIMDNALSLQEKTKDKNVLEITNFILTKSYRGVCKLSNDKSISITGDEI